jgi:hypothetical protein
MSQGEGTDRRRAEHGLAEAWGVPLVAVHCAPCGASYLVAGSAAPAHCPFCLQGPVEVEPGASGAGVPEQALPYRVSEADLRRALERWVSGVWFRPDDMRASVLAERACRYLLPLWLVDGRAQGVWQAEVGFDYQVVSHQDRYSERVGWRSQEVTETRVRWEPRAGRLTRSYENIAAPALTDHRAVISRLGRYDLDQRTAYRPDVLADAVVRVPSLDPEAAWLGAEAALARAVEADCLQATGADHIRAFALQAEYGSLNWTLLLLPAYVTWYREGGRVWPLLANGQTGRVSGARRASARKAGTVSAALGLLALLLFLVGGLGAVLSTLLPPLVALAGAALPLGLLLALTAPVPAIAVWVFNRRSTAAEDRSP